MTNDYFGNKLATNLNRKRRMTFIRNRMLSNLQEATADHERDFTKYSEILEDLKNRGDNALLYKTLKAYDTTKLQDLRGILSVLDDNTAAFGHTNDLLRQLRAEIFNGSGGANNGSTTDSSGV